VRQLDHLVGEIATASAEQNAGIGQINTAVSEMDKVTQATASSAEESAATASQVSAQTNALQQAVIELQNLVGHAVHAMAPAIQVPATPTRAAFRGPVHVPQAVRPHRPVVPAGPPQDEFFK
jgi:methyl-accepting chemotaxis protein